LLEYVTGGTERPSVYNDLSASYAKCLLAVRLRRRMYPLHEESQELDLSEKWFLTGDDELTYPHQGYRALQFHFSRYGGPGPIIVTPKQFVESIWANARVVVELLGAPAVLATHADKVEKVRDLLERGGARAAAGAGLPPSQQTWLTNGWPGWTSDTGNI